MGEVRTLRTPAETGITALFEGARSRLPGDAAARTAAFEGFVEDGLPHRRVEEFKYTDLRAAMREAAPLAPAPAPDAARAAVAGARAFADVEALRLTFVDGHLVADLSDLADLPAGLEIAPLAEAMASGHALLANLNPVRHTRRNPVYQLNSAFMADGALIQVAPGTAVARPIHLRFVATGAYATATRVLAHVGAGAALTLLETHEGAPGASGQPNDVLDLVVEDEARVEHVRVNAEAREVIALSTLAARLGRESLFETINLVVGAKLSRHQVFVAFEGERARARVNGATMLRAGQHGDTTLLADHAAPGGESRELFKTVIDGEAVGVFQGKIVVQPHAQKTDGKMMSRCLLLTDEGQMMNKPELEIFADDVVCGHGATCGALDDELLFYLMARGLPRPEAERLLVQAFLGEALEAVGRDDLREELVGLVEAWLSARS